MNTKRFEELAKAKGEFNKAKKVIRPIGYITAGGFQKTAKGWRKVGKGASVTAGKLKGEKKYTKEQATAVLEALRYQDYKMAPKSQLGLYKKLADKGYLEQSSSGAFKITDKGINRIEQSGGAGYKDVASHVKQYGKKVKDTESREMRSRRYKLSTAAPKAMRGSAFSEGKTRVTIDATGKIADVNVTKVDNKQSQREKARERYTKQAEKKYAKYTESTSTELKPKNAQMKKEFDMIDKLFENVEEDATKMSKEINDHVASVKRRLIIQKKKRRK